MKELKYIGTHQPYGMVIEVEEDKVTTLLKSGEYEELVKNPPKIKVNREEKIDDNSKRVKSRL